MLTLRKAINSDATEILNFDQEYLDPDATIQDIKNKIQTKNILVGIKNNKFVGYIEYEINNNNSVYIDWIVAIKGNGTELLKAFEEKMFSKYNSIKLNISLDSNERKETVLNRLNYYIKFNYRAYDIKYRDSGVLLLMQKSKLL